MFQTTAEMEEFLATKTMRYNHDWIAIWYPFFQRSIRASQRLSIENVRVIISYLNQKSTTADAKLPQNFGLQYDGLKHDQTQRKKRDCLFIRMKTLYEHFPLK